MMKHRAKRMNCLALAVGIVVTAAWLGHAPQASGQLWKKFVPAERVDSDPQSDFRLTEENGPWLIIAATFSGEGAEEQAHDLALEFRSRFNLPAYEHDMAFKFSEERLGRGIDKFGAPVKRRYQRIESHEYAVLVGNFPSIDDPEAQQLLDKVKRLEPNTLNDSEETAQTMAQLREIQDSILESLGKKRKRGPMSHAFMARNPLLPREYFVPKGVDKFVTKMNRGVKYSLLDCPGKYTIKVATFGGRSIIQTSGSLDTPFTSSKREEDPLVEAAENAHLLTTELREHGWEAYEFHDRTESIVTIGAFDEVARQLPDGRVLPMSDVEHIIRTFGAAYDTPEDPLLGEPLSPTNEVREEQVVQRFSQMLSNQQGQIATGLHPKHVKLLKGRRVERVIPIDIHPHTLEVPRRSASSAILGW